MLYGDVLNATSCARCYTMMCQMLYYDVPDAILWCAKCFIMRLNAIPWCGCMYSLNFLNDTASLYSQIKYGKGKEKKLLTCVFISWKQIKLSGTKSIKEALKCSIHAFVNYDTDKNFTLLTWVFLGKTNKLPEINIRKRQGNSAPTALAWCRWMLPLQILLHDVAECCHHIMLPHNVIKYFIHTRSYMVLLNAVIKNYSLQVAECFSQKHFCMM